MDPAAGEVALKVIALLAPARAMPKTQVATLAATVQVPPLATAEIFCAVEGNCMLTRAPVASKGPRFDRVKT